MEENICLPPKLGRSLMSYPSSKFPIVFVTFSKELALSSGVAPLTMEKPLKYVKYIKYTSDID